MRRADRTGRGGEAWDVSAARNAMNKAIVAAWVIRAPGARPLWPWYLALALALDPREGATPMRRLTASCSHELAILTLNPRTFSPRVIDPRREHVYPLTDPEPESCSFECLTPSEISCQIEGETDVVAEMAIGQLVIDLVITGLSPNVQQAEWSPRVHRAVSSAHRVASGAIQETNALPN